MNNEKKPEIAEDKLGINPFLNNLQIPVSKIVIPGQWKADKEGTLLPLEIELEKESSTRVYVDANRRMHMTNLGPRGKDLLLWLIYEADNSKDWLWINYKRYMKECRVKSYNTYITALHELVAGGFLSGTIVKHVYWINPYFFFNGSRVNKFPKNVVRK